MAVPTAHAMHQAGQEWLLSSAPDPAPVLRDWELKELAGIPSGTLWRVVEAPLLESVTAIRRIGADRIGPILGDTHRDRAWWLLPASLGDDLDDIRRFTVHPPGWVLRCPPVGRSTEGRWWVECPDGTGRLTDPVLLAAAFGPGGGFRLPSEDPR